ADIDLAARLDEIRFEQAASGGGSYDTASADRSYGALFRGYGIDIPALPPAEVAARIRASAVKDRLGAALNPLGQLREEVLKLDQVAWKPLLDIARVADPDEDRTRIREALLNRDITTVIRLTHPDRLAHVPVATALYAVDVLRWGGARKQAVELLRQLQRR